MPQHNSQDFLQSLLKKGWLPDGKGGYTAPNSPQPTREARPPTAVAVEPSPASQKKPPRKQKMNVTETRFLHRYILPWMESGEITQWKFEGLRFNLGPGATYTPDFMVVQKSRQIALYEIKNRQIWEDAIVKFKWAREEFPAFTFHMFQHTRTTDNWEELQIQRPDAAGSLGGKSSTTATRE